MTFTPCDLALASMAAPEPESRLTSRRTFAPLVIICSACCCWVDLSPWAFWIVTGTPAALNACLQQRPVERSPSGPTTSCPAAARRPSGPCCRCCCWLLLPPTDDVVVVRAARGDCERKSAERRCRWQAPRREIGECITVLPPPVGWDMCGDGTVSGSVGLVAGEGERAEQLGAVAERRRRRSRRPRRRPGSRSADRLAHRLEQQVAGGAEIAADDDQVRVEVVAEVGHGAADDAAGVGDDALAAGVALLRPAAGAGARSAGRASGAAARTARGRRRRSPGSRGCRSGRSGPADRPGRGRSRPRCRARRGRAGRR